MNQKELIAKISQDTKLPAGSVRKVTTAVLEAIAKSIESDEVFRSPTLVVKSRKQAADAAKKRPERRVGIVHLKNRG